MYDAGITNRFLEAQMRADPSFKAIRHSISDIEGMIELLESAWDDKTETQTRELNDLELSFTENEQFLCTHDFRYFAENYCWIINFEKRLARFRPNAAQRIVLDIWAEMEVKRWAIMMLQLKARQLGVSTLTELAVLHRLCFWSEVDALVASSTPEKSGKMAKMIRVAWDHLPWWLRPKHTRIEDGLPVEFREQHAALEVSAGNKFSRVAAGSTPNILHLSEVCLAPHTLIRVADGRLKPIVDVVEGDSVLTHTGAPATVRKRWLSSRTNEMTSEIWPWGMFAPMVSTLDHRVLTDNGWKEAGSIRSGDYVRHPVRPITDLILDFSFERRSSGQRFQQKKWTMTYPLSREWGYVLGLYLAEGSIQPNKKLADPELQACAVLFTIDQSEVDRFVSRIQDALGKRDHVGIRRRTSRTCTLYVGNSGLARWVKKEFGEKDNKRVPDWAWQSGPDFCMGLVEGYLDGDGHYDKKFASITATSIRVQLSIQMRDLVASLGFGWSSISFKSAGVYYERNCQSAWIWSVTGETANKVRSAAGRPIMAAESALHWKDVPDGNWIDIEVYRVSDGFSETFYDLEIDHNDHSFTTAQCAVHNCEWKNPREDIDAAILNAVHETPEVFFVIESTALGRGNWFHFTWKYSKENWGGKGSKLCPIFLPFYVGRDIYPDEGWLSKHPIPGRWMAEDRLVALANRCADYVHTNDRLKKYLGSNWVMSREQLWWYEFTEAEYAAKNELNTFKAECCADDIDSFSSTAQSAFKPEVVRACRDRQKAPLGVYKLRGVKGSEEDIPMNMRPIAMEVDSQKVTVPISCEWGRFRAEYELVPVKFQGQSAMSEMGLIFIYEWPNAIYEYGYGADTSEGIGQDRCVLEGVRKDTLTQPDEQVFEFASDAVSGLELWPWCMALGTLYSPHGRDGRKQAKASIEVRGSGDALQYELRKRGWANFLIWPRVLDSKKIDLSRANKLGFVTNTWSRPNMVNIVLTWINRDRIQINSPYFIEEMEAFEKDEDSTKIEASYGEHDDRIMAIGFILFAMHIHEIHSDKATLADRREKSNSEEDPIWDPGFQGRDMGYEYSLKVFLEHNQPTSRRGKR